MSFTDLQQCLSSLLGLRCVCVCLGPLVGAAWGAWGPRGVGRTATTRAYGTLGTERKEKEIFIQLFVDCVHCIVLQATDNWNGYGTEVKGGVYI